MDAQTIGAIEGGTIGIIMMLLIGAIAGWIAGLIMKGKGMGFFVNALLGIVGAFVGAYVFNLIGFSVGGGLFGDN